MDMPHMAHHARHLTVGSPGVCETRERATDFESCFEYAVMRKRRNKNIYHASFFVVDVYTGRIVYHQSLASSAAISATPHRGRVKRRADRGPPTQTNPLLRCTDTQRLTAVCYGVSLSCEHTWQIARATAGSNGASSSRPCGTVKHNQGGVDHFGRSNGRQCSPRRGPHL